jgi:hypothetical protein
MLVCMHRGGPLDGEGVSLTAPHTPERLFYAPAPPGTPAITASGHIIVGYDLLPAPWPGVAKYVLDRDGSELRAHDQYEGMEQGTAVYVLEEESG